MKRAGKKYNPYSQFSISSYFCTYSKKREKEKEREKKEGRKKREEGRKEERRRNLDLGTLHQFFWIYLPSP